MADNTDKLARFVPLWEVLGFTNIRQASAGRWCANLVDADTASGFSLARISGHIRISPRFQEYKYVTEAEADVLMALLLGGGV